MKMLIVAILAVFSSACAAKINLPPTREAAMCEQQCLSLRYQCYSAMGGGGQGRGVAGLSSTLVCNDRERECLVRMCGGEVAR